MKKNIKYLAIIAFTVFSLQTQAQKQVKKIKLDELKEMISDADAPLTIFNFWATWCGPCVKELPHINEAEQEYKGVKVVLISLDKPTNLEKLRVFADENGIKPDLYLLDEKNPSDYIPKISRKWMGNIPMSLFVNEMGKQTLYEKSFTKKQLKKAIEKSLN